MSTPPGPAPNQPAPPAENAPADPQAGQPAPPAPAPTPEPAPVTPEATAGPKGKPPTFDGDFDPQRFEKLVENLRGDVAAEKAKREAAEQKAAEDQTELVKKFADLFGIQTGGDKAPTPEELAAQVASAQSETKASRDQARQTAVQLAVYRSAGTHGGNPDALLDSATFLTAVKGLDPSSAGFGIDVQAAVQKAVEANPLLAAKAAAPAPAPTPKGGAPMDGAPGGKRQLGAADVARMTPDQITKAVAEGRFNSYLGSG